MSEQTRIGKPLDQLVAERTRALAEANEALKQELVVERQRTEAAPQNIRVGLNSIPGLVAILTPTGGVDAVNDQLAEYCGRTLEELQQWGTSDTVYPDDLSRVIQIFTQAIASSEPYDFEARLRRFDGAYRWFQIRGLPRRDAGGAILRWYALHTDIDERKRAEDALRHSERHLRQLTETIPVMLWSATPGGAIDYCNARFLEYTGFDAEQLMGSGGFTKILHPDDLDRTVQEWLSCIRTGASFQVEVRKFHAADANYRWCLAQARPLLDEQGRILKWYGTVVDMHDWRQAQDELRHTQEQLGYMMRVTTMGELTASIAHEVNQPLSGIMTNAGTCLRMLAADPPDVDGACETARRTIRDAHRASEVIVRLRALFSGKELMMESTDLNEATREVIALSMSELLRHRVTLRSEFADDLPLVTANRVQLQQVILNLLRNAADAMVGVDEGPRPLLVRTERDEGDRVRLTVQDVGVGLQPHVMDKLFQAFFTTKSSGMGIGLSVSRSIIEKHGGRLWGEPNDGPGATFAFSIPRDPARTTDAAPV